MELSKQALHSAPGDICDAIPRVIKMERLKRIVFKLETPMLFLRTAAYLNI